ncbi:MAG: AAA family ATPase, partial [Alphaproteobacteria bacterium]|nr:AAA family ATPase [Alphaproteobacteria bacterium]
RNLILVMTTNAGAQDMNKNSIGFGAGMDGNKEADTTAINAFFPPEFRNRLDAVVPFQHLKPDTMKRVVDKFVGTVAKSLAERTQGAVHLTLTEQARTWLASTGYDKFMGARPMERLIDAQINDQLVDELLFGKLKKGGSVSFDVSENKKGLTATFTAAVANTKRKVPANDDSPQGPQVLQSPMPG